MALVTRQQHQGALARIVAQAIESLPVHIDTRVDAVEDAVEQDLEPLDGGRVWHRLQTSEGLECSLR